MASMNINHINYFQFYNLEPSIDIDPFTIQKLYISYQRVLHPDKFVMSEPAL